jgi:hypothetical protein
MEYSMAVSLLEKGFPEICGSALCLAILDLFVLLGGASHRELYKIWRWLANLNCFTRRLRLANS